MLIQAPIQKKTYTDFSSSSVDLVKRGGLLWTLQQSTGLFFYPLKCNALFSYAVHFTEKFYKYIYVVSMHNNSIPWIHWTLLYSKLLICSALQCTGLHCSPYSAQHCTALGKVFKSLDIIKNIYIYIYIYITTMHFFYKN